MNAVYLALNKHIADKNEQYDQYKENQTWNVKIKILKPKRPKWKHPRH